MNINNIYKNSKKSYIARIDDKGIPIKNIANFGLPINNIAKKCNGEYNGFAIKALEPIYPLFTNINVVRSIEQLEKDNINAVCDILNLQKEIQEYGLSVLYWAIVIWLLKNELQIPELYLNKYNEIEKKYSNKLEYLKNRILTIRSDPINSKFEIVSIGHNVVPENWLGKIFTNGYELHKEMDKLDWRKGKPPVSYCCINSMIIEDINTWNTKDTIKTDYEILISLYFNNNNLVTKISKNYNLNDIPDNYKLFVYKKKIIFAIDYDLIVDNNPMYERYETVGILVSRLQKCLRRGRQCSLTLNETVNRLANSPPYNLPDQQFLKVSGCRQLCWRLFISIIEDCEPYLPNTNYLSLQDIFCLSLLCQADPDIKLKKSIIDKLLYTSLLCQYNDKFGSNWNWREGKLTPLDEINYFTLAISYMPMMKNDKLMLIKASNFIKNYKLKKLSNMSKEILMNNSNEIIEKQSIISAYDMHCLPNITLEIQGSLPYDFFEKRFTTKNIPSLIWENKSKFNIRKPHKLFIPKWLKNGKKDIILFNKILEEIQEYNYNKEYNLSNDIIENIKKFSNDEYEYEYKTYPKLDGKIAFLTLFGKKIKLNREGKLSALDIVVAGDLINDEICKVKKISKDNKYLEGDEQKKGQERYIKYMDKNNKIMVNLENPPCGYIWIDKIRHKKKVNIYIKNNNFYVDDIKIKLFDARKLLLKIKKLKIYKIPFVFKNIICQSLYCPTINKYNNYEINLINRAIHKLRRKIKDYKVYEWIYFKDLSIIKTDIWRLIFTRLHNGFDNDIFVGPVDRSGNKVNKSINYKYEGFIWRIINLLSALYPACIQIRGYFKWSLNKNALEYTHLIECLNKLWSNDLLLKNKSDKIKINTQLWSHQKQTVDRIFYGYTVENKKGFGDASFVGAGKTLTALTIISKLINYKSSVNKGAVILLPTTKLYKTWFDEINKHCEGFNILFQEANGNIINFDETLNNEITSNTILITTLGRMRNHPISNPWILTVIDECLTVQNKEALQTEEAWKQSMCSEYGVLMMSATFFRSRFDKMFYMLSMLRSGLPEKKEYLDAILAEHIICYIPEKSRLWKESITKYELSKKERSNYNKIKNQEMTNEMKYHALYKYINRNIKYELLFDKRVKELNDRKILIYCKSKNEADNLSKINDSIGRYPDKSKQHIVVSYTEGTYGLNDLIKYDTILTRPPEPDKLPQMKGRLDRPGQLNTNLNLEYILIKDTIEEALLYRLEMCSNFYKNYILPLADFYDLSVKY